MNHRIWSAWIFALLMVLLAMMVMSSSRWVIGLGAVLVPILLALQVYVILKSKEKNEDDFPDKWYGK